MSRIYFIGLNRDDNEEFKKLFQPHLKRFFDWEMKMHAECIKEFESYSELYCFFELPSMFTSKIRQSMDAKAKNYLTE